MDDWFDINADEEHMRRERKRARELRRTSWWKNRIAEGRCHYCGKTLTPGRLTMDHVVPVARGGKSTKGNVVPACPECNRDKKLETPADRIMRELEDGEE
ncbi:HNH endonuclease [Kiritimatiella glycovorans]|uniref:HNH endonuclease n=1 Tax=Kiritimatiella glycovorans TaxID=1307763 RepID=A0A0G3EGT0_9BACT|nr:HNH endonuclease [Kiritimatiella glycovorans]AKJ63329.1 HNH endonuclease [Kiritimatiella glycovorans]